MTYFVPKAKLIGSSLKRAILVDTNISGAQLQICHIYGLSAWNLIGIPEEQSNLIITAVGEAEITVDNLQAAQFIYLL